MLYELRATDGRSVVVRAPMWRQGPEAAGWPIVLPAVLVDFARDWLGGLMADACTVEQLMPVRVYRDGSRNAAYRVELGTVEARPVAVQS